MRELDIKKAVDYWRDSALYDLDTVKSLMASGRYPHALFFSHLVLEKLLKAVFVRERKQHAPFIHSLVMLAKKSDINIPNDMLVQLAEFTQFNIEGRYPEEKESFNKKATKEFASEKFKELEEIVECLREILEKP